MPKDGKHRFSEREHERAMRIKRSYVKRGKDKDEAEGIAWATIVKGKRDGISSLRRGRGKQR